MMNIRGMVSWLRENKKGLMWFWGAIFFIELLSSQIRIVLITTKSIPFKICLQLRHSTPKKYDLSMFPYKGHELVKYIIGVEGDKVINLADAIYVDGFRIGKAKRTKQLIPINDCRVPKGYIFVSGRHPESLDSRYREFGFIKVSDLQGRVLGLVKRNDFQEDTFINWRD